jgi:hypothetical protein
MRTTNLGPGFAFHYQPSNSPLAKLNFDAPEYANIVATTLQHYPEALHAGMARLPRGGVLLLRGWVRLLAGAWTHAGYLNWDTGYGYQRWHSGQYWAFAQQGLLAIATARQFWPHPRAGAWAKALFDRGLILYARWADEGGAGVAPKLPFGVHSRHEDYDLYATRIAANAMRAVGLGLGARPAHDPPPMYAFDEDTGRLAVTTPRYSTAIVPRNRRGPRTAGSTSPGCTGARSDRSAPSAARRRARSGWWCATHTGTNSSRRSAASATPARCGRPGRAWRRPHHDDAPLPARQHPDALGGDVRRGMQVSLRRGALPDVGSPRPRRRGASRRRARPVAAGRGGRPARRRRAVELAGYDIVPVVGHAEALLVLVDAHPQPTNPDPGPTLAIRLLPIG